MMLLLLLLGISTVHGSSAVCEYLNDTNGIALMQMAPYTGNESWNRPNWTCNDSSLIEAVDARIRWLHLFSLMAESFVYDESSPHDCLYQIQIHLQAAMFAPDLMWNGTPMYS